MSHLLLEQERAGNPALGRFRPGIVPIDIVLAYHQAVVRSGLRMLLDGERDFTVVATTANVEGARECVRAHEPDVLVLDLDQPAGSPLEAIKLLGKEAADTRLVVMSSRRDPAFVRAAIEAGAHGYVPSAGTADDLTSTIRRAATATSPPDPYLDAGLAGPPPSSGPQDLSPREVEVLSLIAMGHTNAEIGRQLTLSVRTVETHRSHIRHKLECPTRAQLVEYAFAQGISRRR